MANSLVKKALKSKKATEAIGEGIITLLETHNFNSGWNAMLAAARNNGSLSAVKGAFIADVVNAIAARL